MTLFPCDDAISCAAPADRLLNDGRHDSSEVAPSDARSAPPPGPRAVPGWWERFARLTIPARGNTCEHCGLTQGQWVLPWAGEWLPVTPDEAAALARAGHWLIRVRLELCHRDHARHTRNAEDYLVLCHRCHMAFDADHIAAARRQTARLRLRGLRSSKNAPGSGSTGETLSPPTPPGGVTVQPPQAAPANRPGDAPDPAAVVQTDSCVIQMIAARTA